LWSDLRPACLAFAENELPVKKLRREADGDDEMDEGDMDEDDEEMEDDSMDEEEVVRPFNSK